MPAAKNKNIKAEKNIFQHIASSFEDITSDADKFLKPLPAASCATIRELIKQTYNATLQSDPHNAKQQEILPELVVDADMDEEQIWQQLELRNELVLNQFTARTAKIMALPEESLEIRLNEEGVEEEEEDEEEPETDDDSEAQSSEDEQNGASLKDEDTNEIAFEEVDSEDEVLGLKPRSKGNRNTQRKGGARSSIVDDKFFKLSEMEAFLEQEDEKETRKQQGKQIVGEDAIDYFADDLGGDDDDDDDDAEEDNASEDGNANFNDFFDAEEIEQQDKGTKLKNSKNQKLEAATKNKKTKQKDYFADSDENDGEAAEQENDKADEQYEEDFQEDSETEQQNDNNKLQMASDSDDDDSGDDDDEDDAEKEKLKSSYELKEARLQQRIRDYEEELLGEKPWQLRGEIKAVGRPQNSLLEEILEFESTVRPAPVITEATTQCLEEIIKQRIKDQAWDDVVHKVRPTQTAQDFRKQLVLDQEKSKESLAQIYEKEYQLQANDDAEATGDAAEPKQYTEIKRMMRELFVKLDALSNFHFTPKPVAPEPKIITNTPAVTMEEVAPLAVSDATLLAPKEIYRGPKHEPMGKTERTRTDKNRERRKKKQKQRAINRIEESRDLERQRQGKPLSKKAEGAKLLKSITKQRNVQTITTSNDQGALKSSKAFFNKLQDKTTSIANGKRAAKKPHTGDPTRANAKKLKL